MRAASEGNTAAAPSTHPPVEVKVEPAISPTPTDSSEAAPDASTKTAEVKGRPKSLVVDLVG